MNIFSNVIVNVRRLIDAIMFALGLVRWYRTPEAKALLALLDK